MEKIENSPLYIFKVYCSFRVTEETNNRASIVRVVIPKYVYQSVLLSTLLRTLTVEAGARTPCASGG